MAMSDKEIETLAELISIKTADRYLSVTKELIANSILLHSTTCEKDKYKKVSTAIVALISGIVVTVINLFIAWFFDILK